MQASQAVKTPEPKPTGEPKLKKCVSLFDATVYGVGIILGAGIYALIGEAAGIAGNARKNLHLMYII